MSCHHNRFASYNWPHDFRNNALISSIPRSNVDDAASNAKGEAKKGASKAEDAADDAAGSVKSGAKDAKKEVC